MFKKCVYYIAESVYEYDKHGNVVDRKEMVYGFSLDKKTAKKAFRDVIETYCRSGSTTSTETKDGIVINHSDTRASIVFLLQSKLI